MSGVTDGQRANQTSFNAAFMARNGNTDTTGRVSLLNIGSGNITDLQKFLNDLSSYIGTVENDPDFKLYSSNEYILDGDSIKECVEVLDNIARFLNDEIDAAKLRIDAAEISIADHETRLDTAEPIIASNTTRLTDIESNNSTFAGDKTFSDDVIIEGNLTVQGTTTTINSTITEITDPTITLNNGGTDATSEGAGIEIERTADNALIAFKNSLASKFEIGLIGFLYEVLVSGVDQIIDGIKTFNSGIKVGTITALSPTTGVEIEGVNIEDGLVAGQDVQANGLLLESHVIDTSIHFTEASINHANILNTGVNSHDDIDLHIADTANPHAVTKTQVGLGNVTDDAQLLRDPDFQNFAVKASAVGADLLLIEDSNDAFAKKYITVGSLPSGGGGGGAGEHTFKLNGNYGSIVVPANAADSLYRFLDAGQITNVTLVREIAGTSGQTEIDVQVKPPAGSWTSIFTTLPQISAAAGNEVGVRAGEIVPNTVAPVLSASPFAVAAGTLMRFNLIQKEAGNPDSISVIVKF